MEKRNSKEKIESKLSKGKLLIQKGTKKLIEILSQVKENISTFFSRKKVIEDTQDNLIGVLKEKEPKGKTTEKKISSGESETTEEYNLDSSLRSEGHEISEGQEYQFENIGGVSEEIMDQISNEIMKLSQKDVYASGSEGEIYKIEVTDKNGEKKQYLAAKKRFDNKFSNELEMHKSAQELLPIGDNLVRVPELKVCMTIYEDNYLVMEFIEGKTMYTLVMEKILQKLLGDKNIDIKNDKQADAMFDKYCQNMTREEKDRLFESHAKTIKLFDPQEGKKYEHAAKEFFKRMHDNGIYHRDVHWKNVIVGTDKKLYVIDFGKATMSKDADEAYNGHHGDKVTERYQNDSWLESEIANATFSQEDYEGELISKQAKERAREIEKSDSIINIINEIPKSFLPKGMDEDTFKSEVKDYTNKYGKRISISELMDAKVGERKIMYFAQSIENLEELLSFIDKRKNNIEENLRSLNKDSRAEQPIFRKDKIAPLEKELKSMLKIQLDLNKIKSLLSQQK